MKAVKRGMKKGGGREKGEKKGVGSRKKAKYYIHLGKEAVPGMCMPKR
jgi:hypothetical protein